MYRFSRQFLLLSVALTGCRSPQTSTPKPKPVVVSGSSDASAPPAIAKTDAVKTDGTTLRPTQHPALSDLPPQPDAAVPDWGKNAPAAGTSGVVTSVEKAATQIGIATLEKGGNAIDAAIATAFALAVTHPSAGNIGGGGFMLIKVGGQIEALDFRENSPKSLTDKEFWKMIQQGGRGQGSAGVPGTVAGLALAHQLHGHLPWHELVLPAERLARDGYVLGVRQAKTIAWSRKHLKSIPQAKALFFHNNQPKKAGDRVKNPDLAEALRRIRIQGRAGFYEGRTAKDIVSALSSEGLMTLDDLKSYQAKRRHPLFFNFGNYRVITMPSPSAGGVALAQNLLMLQELAVDKTSANSAARIHLTAEASRRAQAERQLFVVSPDELTQSQRKEARDRALNPTTWLKAHPVTPNRATPSRSLHKDYPLALKELEHTTHLSVIDKKGNLVSCTVTLSGSFGSRIFTSNTGIILNNSVASFSSIGVNTPQAGVRTTSSMAPTLVLLGEDNALVLGSPGGDTIPSTLTQTFLRLAVDNNSLKQAVLQARFHQAFAPDSLSMERWRPLGMKMQQDLRNMGYSPQLTRSTIGDANIAAKIGSETFAISDPREGGLAQAARITSSSSKEK